MQAIAKQTEKKTGKRSTSVPEQRLHCTILGGYKYPAPWLHDGCLCGQLSGTELRVRGSDQQLDDRLRSKMLLSRNDLVNGLPSRCPWRVTIMSRRDLRATRLAPVIELESGGEYTRRRASQDSEYHRGRGIGPDSHYNGCLRRGPENCFQGHVLQHVSAVSRLASLHQDARGYQKRLQQGKEIGDR